MKVAAANPIVYIVGAAAAIGVAVLAMAGKQDRVNAGQDPDDTPIPDLGPEPVDPMPPQTGGDTTRKPKPIAVGAVNDPEIAALLTAMRDVFASEGVNLQFVTPREVTTMRKTPTRAIAIPPEPYWYGMAATLRDAFTPVRVAFGEPITIYNGYRPPDYNKAVTCEKKNNAGECIKWSKGSRHQWFEAVDLMPVNATGEARRRLARIAASLYVQHGAALKLGFGVYGSYDFPTGVHLDTGWRQRTWGRAGQYVNAAGGQA